MVHDEPEGVEPGVCELGWPVWAASMSAIGGFSRAMICCWKMCNQLILNGKENSRVSYL